MKKLATLAVIATAILSACNGGKLREAEAQNEQLKGDLCETLATVFWFLSMTFQTA